jgi:transposase
MISLKYLTLLNTCTTFQIEEKIIPAFNIAHGGTADACPGHKAVFLIDNSQGHSAYAKNALVAKRLNLNPGGKQARMKPGWFMKDGVKVIQPMIFDVNHPQHPNQPKGSKAVLQERGLWQPGLLTKCKKDKATGIKCTSKDCCAHRILENQPDFLEQKSLVQETIERLGHLCLFLPKYHCELNFIEYFWGAMKKYLRDHTDYTFPTLKENIPKAMASIPLETIRKWEQRTIRWCEAYQSGKGAKEAQLAVKQFGSKHFKSHRRVTERYARAFDAPAMST